MRTATRWSGAGGRRSTAAFQVYLWGCVDGFRRDVVQAYRWVLELGGGEGQGFHVRESSATAAAAKRIPAVAMAPAE
jgi:hypothetical protein